MSPTFFDYAKSAGHFNYLSELPAIDGECRDAKWISYAGGRRILVIARNNDELVFLKLDF